MTTVVTDRFRALLYASLDKTVPIDPATNLMVGKSVHWTFFRSYAAFTDANDPRYTAIQTVADLAAIPGWSPAITPNSATQAVGATTPGSTTTFCIANNPFAMGGGWASSTVVAAALVLEGTHSGTVDPIIYLTDDPFEGGMVLDAADTLLARPSSAVAGNRPLFSWPVFVTGQTTTVVTPGSVAVLEAPPTYELAYTRHCWLYPQRINFIANPSFELGTNHWRTNGALTRVQGTAGVPAAPGGGAWFGRFAGTNVVAESNTFPLSTRMAVEDHWTIQAMVRGTGQLRVALLGWEPEVVETRSDWGDSEVWTLPATGFLHLYALRRSGDTTMGMVRFECTGQMEIDNVMVEPDWLKDWPYFDGDSTYGARDDYEWYGGENRKGQTYSTWYNHKRAVTGRLFAWDISSEDFTITDEEVEAQGFVYKWVPAGVRVTPHLDVLFPNDIQEVVSPVSGTVTRYKTDANDAMGVTNPWAADQYLNPTVGIVSTPDIAAFAITTDVRFTARVSNPNVANTGVLAIASQFGIAGQRSWVQLFYLARPLWQWTRDGTTTLDSFGATVPETAAEFSNNTPFYIGSVVRSTLGQVQGITSKDGVTWTPFGALSTTAGAGANPFNSTDPVRVGSYQSDANGRWPGRIYWAQLETIDASGNPTGVVWRFDATEYPGSGTVYTDPRGRVWTLTSAAAIART
jgi:hypothetical protein